MTSGLQAASTLPTLCCGHIGPIGLKCVSDGFKERAKIACRIKNWRNGVGAALFLSLAFEKSSTRQFLVGTDPLVT